MNQISLDSTEMKDFLHHIVSNNRYIQEQGKTPVAVEMIGDAGLGKTSIAIELAKELGLNLVKLNLSQLEELGDLIGFPIRQFELCLTQTVNQQQVTQKHAFKKVQQADGTYAMVKVPVTEVSNTTEVPTECLWVDENAIDEYVKRGYKFTGNKRMSYCPPEWIADKTGGGILILDDYTRADQRFLQCTMELIDRQQYISWKLPKDWHIILTSNPDNGEYLVNTMDVAQKTRFISTYLKWNADRWAEWAETAKIDGRCINFILMNSEIVGENKGVNPRSLTTFFNCISSFQDFNQRLPMIQNIGEGSVGPEVATMFTSFIKNKLDLLISPKDMLLRPGHEAVLKQIEENVNENGSYRADIGSVLTTRLINFAVTYAADHSITPEIIERIQELVKADVFTDDLKYIIVKKILNGNKQKFQKLISDPIIQDLATK